jgi:aryl-alcohol dehydrogenase-like predicted oxidoreductase
MTSSQIPKRKVGAPPVLALGAMNFGKRTPAAESERIVRRALERGIRWFDTANVYSGGESERILGRALGRDRGSVTLASKVGAGLVGGIPEGLSRAAIARAIAGSLKRLSTDFVDLYYLHLPDHVTPVEESLDAMLEIVDAGKARAWGVSNYASWQILEMSVSGASRGLPPPAVSQVLFNVLHRQLEIEYFAFARRSGIHTTVYNPLAGGLLAGTYRYGDSPTTGSRFDGNTMYKGRYWTRSMFERVEELRAIADAEGLTMVQLAYAWVAASANVDSILVGPATVQHLDDAIEATARVLSGETLSRIRELGRAWSGTDTNYVR